MSRIRTIKPEFWASEQVISCSLNARLLFIGLWNFSDDNGVHPASYIRLKAEVFPIDDFSSEEIKIWVNELISHNLLSEYEAGNKSYWIVTGWKSHQRIDKPTYKHPLPSTNNDNVIANNQKFGDSSSSNRRLIADNSMSNRRIVDEPSGTERNGMEGIGKEKEDICEVGFATSPVCNIEILEVSKTNTQQPHSDSLSLPATLPFPSGDIAYIDAQRGFKKASIDEASGQKDQQNEKVTKIFKFWQQTMNKPKAILDHKRRSKILAALKLGYSAEQLCGAVTGCYLTPFNMGKNDRGQKYDDITLILRDSHHIEKFIDACGNAENHSHSAYSDIVAGAL